MIKRLTKGVVSDNLDNFMVYYHKVLSIHLNNRLVHIFTTRVILVLDRRQSTPYLHSFLPLLRANWLKFNQACEYIIIIFCQQDCWHLTCGMALAGTINDSSSCISIAL